VASPGISHRSSRQSTQAKETRRNLRLVFLFS
jgi:hypothetical protein